MWQEPTPYAPYPESDVEALKLLFAAALLRNPHNPSEAAREIEPTNNPVNVAWIINNWLSDPVVVAAMVERKAALGATSGLPTKEEFALSLYQDAKAVKDSDTKLKYMRTFAEVMGYIEKNAGVQINNANVGSVQKIMKVPHFRNLEEWEASAIQHHKALTS